LFAFCRSEIEIHKDGKMQRVLIIINICIFIGILAGCGDDEILLAPDDNKLISEGWSEYGAGNYEDAIAKYQEALAEDESSSEAHNGIGWCKARLGETHDAIESFKEAVGKDPGNTDAHAGLAGAYFADGDYERAIASAQSVLSLSPEYSSHHDDIRTADIRVLLAECYYNVGDYNAARAQIDLLGGSGRALDPSSPTYLADLLSVIEELTRREI
jgi:tetratricopeptide (TPR) repeat protein